VATYHAIAATSRAVLSYLEGAFPRDEFGAADFKLYHADNFQNPMAQGFSLFLYRVTVNTSLRNLPPRVTPDGRRYRPSLPLDLHFLITPWASDVEKQEHLLGWCLRTLEDIPILPTGLLNHFAPEAEAFRPNETVELICDPLPLQDMINMWENLGSKLQTSITYVLRMITIDSNLELQGQPVQTRDLEFGE
jgi:hypothetical protein